MSSGKGDLSRLYKTTDACQTWKLVFTNPDKEGFWDAISFPASKSPFSDMGYVIGDPVSGVFALFESADAGTTWHRWQDAPKTVTHCKRYQAAAKDGEALFAASNTSLLEFFGYNFLFVTGGHFGSRLFYANSRSLFGDNDGPCKTNFPSVDLPLARGTASSGSFAMAVKERSSYFPFQLMVVGGDFSKPAENAGTAAFLKSEKHGGRSFKVTTPTTPPHGYRSSVAYDPTQKAWITVGPNGTDLSTDDGRNWHPLKPAPTDPPDADRNWNALSLPFVVGPHGRIGLLNPAALAQPYRRPDSDAPHLASEM